MDTRELNQELSDYIKLIRFKNKKSQDEVSKMLDVSRNTYINWENNPIQLTLEKVIQIGKCFDEDITIFFNLFVANRNRKKD